MKVLVVGEFRWEIYEKPLYESFLELGYDTQKFEWKPFFESNSAIIKLIKRVEAKFRTGPSVYMLNRSLLKKVLTIRPDLVFIYQGVFCSKKTIKTIRNTGAIVFGYCNDDPFSHITPKYYWRKYLKSCTEYSHIFSYRVKNIEDYRQRYQIDTELLRSYYLKNRNYKMEKSDDKYRCDVLFVGHFENDGRDDALVKIAEMGYTLKIFGEGWQRSVLYNKLKAIMEGEIQQLREDYNKAINSCKIALVFLSKRNNDTYTRRCFEIPVTGTFMLSEYSQDLTTLFTPDRETVYFKSSEEMISKVEYYLKHEDERKIIAANGYSRVIHDGHEIADRVKQIVRSYDALKSCKSNCEA